MSTSGPQREPLLCDTGPIRYFTLTGHADLLIALSNGRIVVPREVFDLDDDPGSATRFLSEVGESERYWAKRSREPDAMEHWSRLRALRQRADIEVLGMDEGEVVAYAELTSARFARERGVGRLGRGESAVIAIAEARGLPVAIDDGHARRVLEERSPQTSISTTWNLLRRAAIAQLITSGDAEVVYADMLAASYRGPPKLW